MDINPLDYDAYQQWAQEQSDYQKMRGEGLQASGAIAPPPTTNSPGSSGQLMKVIQFLQAASPQVQVGNVRAGVGQGPGASGGAGNAAGNMQMLALIKMMMDKQQAGRSAGGPSRIR